MQENTSIGRTIRELRRSRNLTGEALACKAGLSQSKLSKIETDYIANPKAEDIRRILDILDAPMTIRQRLSNATIENTFHLHPFTFNYPFEQMLERQTKATRINIFSLTLIPSLLQTHAYRQALYHALYQSDKDFKRFMKVNADRQDMMWDSRRRYHIIIAESALYTRLGNNTEHIAQLDRIDRFIGAPQHIKVGIIPHQSGFISADLNTYSIYDNTVMTLVAASGDASSTDHELIQLHLKFHSGLERLTDYTDGASAIVHQAIRYFS